MTVVRLGLLEVLIEREMTLALRDLPLLHLLNLSPPLVPRLQIAPVAYLLQMTVALLVKFLWKNESVVNRHFRKE